MLAMHCAKFCESVFDIENRPGVYDFGPMLYASQFVQPTIDYAFRKGRHNVLLLDISDEIFHQGGYRQFAYYDFGSVEDILKSPDDAYPWISTVLANRKPDQFGDIQRYWADIFTGPRADVKTNEEIDAYLKKHPDFDPYSLQEMYDLALALEPENLPEQITFSQRFCNNYFEIDYNAFWIWADWEQDALLTSEVGKLIERDESDRPLWTV